LICGFSFSRISESCRISPASQRGLDVFALTMIIVSACREWSQRERGDQQETA
jgi:hypothetical protein